MQKNRVLERPGKKVILLANEAIVRGALEAGVGFAATYPGTPTSEIGDTFAEISGQTGVYFEYGTNEKVALEAAAGAAFSGVRSLVAFKQFGLNVASDSLFPLPYYGPKAGMVIVIADDPNGWSSGQSEQDSRCYARIAHLPMLEPVDAMECREFVKLAFEVSEEFSLPVIIRLTTRVAHASGIVKLGNLPKPKTRGVFIRDRKWRNMPPFVIKVHEELHEKLNRIMKSRLRKLNAVFNGNTKGDLGIVASSVSFDYVMEALEELNLKLPVLKLGFTYPVDRELTGNFIKPLKRLLVVEELEAVLEIEIKEIAKDSNPKLEVHGKDLLPVFGEFSIGKVAESIAKLTGKKITTGGPKAAEMQRINKLLVNRGPVLCPGCPHRASFWAAKQAVPGAVYGGDVGCYILGIYRPLETQDWIISMGATQGICHGIKKVSDQKVISFLGDGTFFHAGIPGTINIAHNQSNVLTIVLDNRVTAMTGHQPNAGSGKTATGAPAKELNIADIAKACGMDNVDVTNPFNVPITISKIKELVGKPGPSLLVSRQECRLTYMRRAAKEGRAVPVFQIEKEKCTKCGICLYEFGCPAIGRDKEGNFYIDPKSCWGCGVCPQVCPAKAISVRR